MIDWLNDVWDWVGANEAQVSVLATIALVVVTAVYAFLTYRATSHAGDSAKAAQATADATAKAALAAESQIRMQAMPFLVPSVLRLFKNEDEHLELEVALRNEGSGAAINVAVAAAYFGSSFEERRETPFRRVVSSISAGTIYPPTGHRSWILPSAQSDLDSWITSAERDDVGVVVICAAANDDWYQFVHWKKRNRTEFEVIERPGDAGYDD